jgi:6-phosphogluconolactonase
MKTRIAISLMSIVIVTSSCMKNEKLFLASGYTAENKYDVMLGSLGANGEAGTLTGLTVGENPSFFTFGRGGLVYFVNEVDTFSLKAGGGITTIKVDRKTTSITKVNSINQGGGGPCHITVSNDGRYLITANYGSGSISSVRLSSDGIPERVADVIFYGEKSHPHMTIYNPRLHTYYVSDLGLDRIHQLKLDTATGLLINASVPYFRCEQGSGPRHMMIDKTGANLYVINELNSTLSVYNILSDTVEVKQTVSTLPDDCTEKTFCADLHLSGNGKMIYGSNRGHNSIVTFRVGHNGSLSQPSYHNCGGNWPRNFALTPSGKYIIVANQKSDEISVIATRGDSEKAVSKLPFNAPACVQFLKP